MHQDLRGGLLLIGLVVAMLLSFLLPEDCWLARALDGLGFTCDDEHED